MNLLAQQLDFLFGVQGLAFVVLAAGNRVLAGRDGKRRLWDWFGLTAFFWGLCQWQDLVSWSVGDGRMYYLVRLILSSVACFALIEFNRRARAFIGKQPPPLWIHVIFAASGFSGAAFGPAALDLSFHFGLGIPAGIWTIWTLWRIAVREANGRAALRVAVFAFAIYIILAAIEVPLTSFDEGIHALRARLHQASIALRYAMTGAAVIFAAAMWKFLRYSYFSDVRLRRILPLETAIVWSVPLILIFGLVGTSYTEQSIIARETGQLREAASILADESEWRRIPNLTGTEADLAEPAYIDVKRRLMSLRNAVKQCRFVYLMRRTGDEIIFLADSEPVDSADYSPPGQVYSEAPAEILPLFASAGRLALRYEDRWGRFDSAFVSVVNRESGVVEAVLGIDIDSARLDEMAREARLPPLIITILFAGLVVTFLMAKQHDTRAKWLLAQAEESMTALLDNIPETACLVDIRGQVLACNSEMRRRELRGAENEENLSLPALVPAFREFWTGDQWSELHAGHPGRFHNRYDDREVDYRVQPVMDGAGRVSRLAILGIDVTERLRIEEALRAGEERFRDMALSSADWMWEVDATGKYTFASGRVEDVLGYRPEEVIGKSPFEFMDADESNRIIPVFREIAARRAPIVDLENRCRHRDGREVVLLTNGVPILSASGDLMGYRGVDKDVTVRMSAQQALRDSEERFRALAENSPDVIMRFDREGRHLYVNPAVTRFTCFSPSDCLGKTHRELGFPENLCDLWEGAIRRTFTQGCVERVEFDLPDGTAMDWLLVPEFDASGAVTHVMTSARDITARKMAEEALRSTLDRLELMVAERTEKLRRANELLEGEVAERRRIEVALRRSEERFRSLVETNNDWICEITVAAEFTYNSPQVERLLGYEPDELINKPFSLILSPDEAVRFRRHFDSIASIGGRMRGFEWTAISREGRSVVFETNAEPFFDEGRLVRGYRAIHRDITERKAAEVALRDSEERFRQLFEGVTDALFVHEIRVDGSPGRFVEVNDLACRRLGYSREELLRMSPREIDAQPPEGKELTPIGQQLRAGRFLTFEQVHVARDGRRIPVEISSHMFELAGRSMVMSIARDITQRKEAERALRESEERFRLLTEESLTGVFLQREGRLTYSNRRLAQMLGYRPEDIPAKLGTHVLEFVHPGDRDQVRANLEARARGGNPPHEYECRMLREDGKSVWVTMLVSQIFHDGIPSTIGHVIDVSERKRGEERLRFLSYHDPQTGLRNRTFFEELMERYSNGERMPGPVSIVVADIDGLKVVNDTFGHRAGDEHIATFARMLADTFNGANEVCRVGGDEFCVVMPDTPIDLVSLRVTELLERVKRFNSRSPRIPISVSIGHSTSHSARESIFEVYQRADDNMYQYKLTQIESPKSRIIDILLMALAERDFVLQGHVERMVHMVGRMAELVGLPEHRKRDLILFARVHDLGKVGIPDEILFKPSVLTSEEYAKIKMHVQIGHKIASRSRELAHIANLVLHHHEFWDGNGYPSRLRGEEIPLECRILAVVDAYDAMTQSRPYSSGRTHDDALEELRRCSGRQFDPRLVDVFIEMLRTMPAPPPPAADIGNDTVN